MSRPPRWACFSTGSALAKRECSPKRVPRTSLQAALHLAMALSRPIFSFESPRKVLQIDRIPILATGNMSRKVWSAPPASGPYGPGGVPTAGERFRCPWQPTYVRAGHEEPAVRRPLASGQAEVPRKWGLGHFPAGDAVLETKYFTRHLELREFTLGVQRASWCMPWQISHQGSCSQAPYVVACSAFPPLGACRPLSDVGSMSPWESIGE